MIISEHFNEPIQFYEDRRKKNCDKTYILEARVTSRPYQSRKSGLWRICFDNLDDAVELESAFIHLHYCYIGDTHIYPPISIDTQLNLF